MAGKFYKRLLAGAVVFLALLLAGCGVEIQVSSPSGGGEAGGNLKVHFIDVGQGDSTLIEQDGHFMLIDAGERDQGEVVVSYLKKQGVKKLDYVIGTHPHSDHIGGMAEVFRAFDIGRVIMPAKEHTIRTYENLLDEIAAQNLKVTLPKAGDIYELADSSFQIIAPVRDYGDNLNNWSVGIRLAYGETGFVFCGDAEKEAEGDIVSSGLTLKADVLKISHHGSSTSSSSKFMDLVDPDYGVISCGKNNDYGHPHKEIRAMLKERNIKSFRTDELGTIVAASDGKSVTFPGQETGDLAPSEAKSQDYVFNTNTRKFHFPDCKSAASMKKENRKTYTGTREDVIKMGYEPCQICNP